MSHILYWNSVALEANRRDFSNVPGSDKPSPEQGGPTLSSRALAIVHLAIYDAHAGCVNSPALPHYITPSVPAKPGASAAAAVAAAAHACLSALYPKQKPHFDTAHENAGLKGTGLAEGHEFGLEVAKTLLKVRKDDPGAGDNGYAASMHACGHRPDPINPAQGYHAPFYGAQSKCFAVTQRHELDPPPAHGGLEYDQSLKQVRGKGIAPELMGTLPSSFSKRTVDETLIGLYWAYDGVRELGTPPRLYNLIVREVAKEQNNSEDDNALLFALVNVAMGDAGILAWDQKYIHNFWRPVLGVREHDPSMGPGAATPTHNIDNDCDPIWEPLGAPASNSKDANFTPPFPAYPSGHASFGAAAFQIVRLFYGITPGSPGYQADAIPIFTGAFVSEELNGKSTDNKGHVRPRHVRNFPRGLWQMIEENGFSRIWLGVHWSFDAFALDANNKPDLTRNIGGVKLGLKIAEDIFAAGGGVGSKKVPKKSEVGPRV